MFTIGARFKLGSGLEEVEHVIYTVKSNILFLLFRFYCSDVESKSYRDINCLGRKGCVVAYIKSMYVHVHDQLL